jgi:tryptophan halogenase
MGNLDGKPLAEPRYIPYVPGRRRKSWNRNCVAIGLAAGFFEPIESTNIHLIQTAIARLVTLFPHAGLDAADIDEFNAQAEDEYQRIRDFIILHYKATVRDDSPFWNHCREMSVPDTLRHRIDLFRSNGRIFRENNELFAELSWLQVMYGQRLRPKGYHPFADLHAKENVGAFLDDVETVIRKCVDVMPTHAEFIARNCAAGA